MQNDLNEPHCFFPPRTGYRLLNSSAPSTFWLRKSADSPPNPFGPEHALIRLDVKSLGAGLYLTLGPVDARKVPVQLDEEARLEADDGLELVTHSEELFWFQVRRQKSKALVWDTSLGE